MSADLDLDQLTEWIAERRWFGSKGRQITQLGVVDMPTLDPAPPRLLLALVETRFAAGTHEIYQVPLVLAGAGELPREARVAAFGEGEELFDALAEPRDPPRLLRLITDGATVPADGGEVAFCWHDGAAPPPPGAEVRPVASEQSNSSVIFGENAILKVYRRVEAGVNPELEILRFLGERGFRHTPALLGWYEYRGRAVEATLGIVQELVADGRDGWELVLDRLAGDPEALLEPLRELGATIGAMHTELASDPTDPVFAPEERGNESLALLVATLDEEIERVFVELPPEDERVAPIAHAGEALRDQVRAFAGVGNLGMAIRVHGDLHLGQTLLSDRGWTILDFEGEPARPLPERRAKHSPLRDVAGIIRSLAYAPLAARLQRGAEPPEDWEARAREALLDGYLDKVEPTLLPATRHELDQVLALYELEKAVYELSYELNHRPDWVRIPVAVIARLLEAPTDG